MDKRILIIRYYEETWPRTSPSLTRGPRTDMSRPGIKPGPPRWEASTLEKSHSKSLLIAIRNSYIWARNQWRMLEATDKIIKNWNHTFYWTTYLVSLLTLFWKCGFTPARGPMHPFPQAQKTKIYLNWIRIRGNIYRKRIHRVLRYSLNPDKIQIRAHNTGIKQGRGRKALTWRRTSPPPGPLLSAVWCSRCDSRRHSRHTAACCCRPPGSGTPRRPSPQSQACPGNGKRKKMNKVLHIIPVHPHCWVTKKNILQNRIDCLEKEQFTIYQYR